MFDTNRKNKTITEGEIATLLQRYDAKTILRLLQEISFYADIKMDWNEIVKKTTTGITNAREYQLLWRHLSYREPLLPVEDDDQPMDDDSDMEFELEASPGVSFEASVEARAHVRVMAASYVPSESDLLDESTSEAPLMINVPYSLPEGIQEPSESPWSSSGMNITFPVRLQKVSSTEVVNNGNGLASGSKASQKKRQRWSAEEDDELIAAVKLCGEGNWTHIAKGEFRGKRTATQLSQRWPHIRKRCDIPISAGQSVVQPTEAIAVNRALSMALGNKPPSKKVAVGALPATSSCNVTETQGDEGRSSQGQQQSKPVVQALARASTSVPASKSRVAVRRTTTSRLDLMVTANSAAAAACMGGVSSFASVPKVEPGKTGAPLVPNTQPGKTASTACLPRPPGSFAVPKVEPGKSVAGSGITKGVGPANTQPLANGNLKLVTPLSSSFKPNLVAPHSEGSTMLAASTPLASAPKIVSNQRVFAASVPVTVLPPKPTVEIVSCNLDGGQKVQAREDVANQPNKMTSTNSEISRGKQAVQAPSPNLLPRTIPVVQTAVLGATNRNSVDRTTVPSVSGAGSLSEAKCEVNNKVGPVIKVSSVCGKPTEVASVGGTGQDV